MPDDLTELKIQIETQKSKINTIENKVKEIERKVETIETEYRPALAVIKSDMEYLKKKVGQIETMLNKIIMETKANKKNNNGKNGIPPQWWAFQIGQLIGIIAILVSMLR